MKSPAKDRQCSELYDELLPNCADYVALHAKQRPKGLAIIEHNTGEKVTWKTFQTSVNAFAAKLLSLGLKRGDIVATSLPLLKEHVYLMYACFRIGLVVAPLDLRLKAVEIRYCMEKMKPRAYFFLGKTPLMDFRPMIKEVMADCPFIEHWVQFQKEEDLIMEGAVGITDFVKDIKRVFIKSLLTGAVKKAHRAVGRRDACLIIFTTGSTGSPKPAMLCHENILIQNIGLIVGFEGNQDDRMLVNLPPSHVGCTTEQLATIIYGGGIAVILHIFDAKLSLEAIEKHKITMLGQIPALYNMEWRLSDYYRYDLSSLRFAIYGGQAVPREFLVKMKQMAPCIGTGLGLTETAGFCTYTHVDADVDELAEGIGYDSVLCPISIREPMNADGTAGREKQPGEVGEICFSGQQIFLGYLGDPENTAKTISTDGVCYTGDLGYYDDKGLHFAGRAKLVIKPKGYQVYPEDVENHIVNKLRGRISMAAVVGVEHEVFSEGIMVFVETSPGQSVTPEEVMGACSDISAYSRPSHVVVYDAGELPLNRVAKTDYMVLRDRAKTIVNELRDQGRWDRK
ncbi:MAG TPA: class I adenylate-forming enzyme family protein [Deltaproteobacteria bacterium]|nr:class I adenylate-forming enzyme family protein [Deltaproteobacteria bacterium]HPJ95201.1 class I adenylate-forming enzyme family protein [Deltaproteobacteria bacterium]